MLRTLFIFTILLFAFQSSDAQQNNTWYFGQFAGLKFGTSNPVVLHNSAMDAHEGSATICDATGGLLFYTNGVTVFNRNHQPMLNGTGLMGNTSTVQAAIIVPMPGDPNIYYIFTGDAIENNFANGYNYSIVDMSRDGGKGEVTSKNVLLHASSTERMTAARHADGTSVWLITNDKSSNTFRSWLIDCGGLHTSTVVVSTVGDPMNEHFLTNVGMMKVSPDGKQLCQTHFPDDASSFSPTFFQLFDFNNLTGVISNGRKINFLDAQVTNCEFSPNSKLLYLGRPYDKKMDQVEATLPTIPDIIASRYTFSTPGNVFHGIQLAPDQRIYLAQPGRYLGSINNPNVKGAGCDYQERRIDVNEDVGSQAYAGLPTYINDLSFDGSNGFNYTILDSCTGAVQFNGFSTIPGVLTWNWDFGDGFTSNMQNPLHTFSALQPSYKVRLRIQASGGCGVLDRIREVIPKGLILNAGFDFTAKCDSGYVRFTNTSVFSPDSAIIHYLWDFGDGNTSVEENPIHPYPGGIFNVKFTVQTTTACLDRSVTKPINLEILDIHAPADMEVDAGETIQLGVTGGGTVFTWTPINGLSNPAIADPTAKPPISTMYVVTAFNDAGCKDIDSVFIKVKPVPGIYVPTGFTPNNDGKNDVFRPLISDEFTLQEFTIYNRWGEKIFTTSQKNVGWNGKIKGIVQDSGVYVWIVNATDTRDGKKHERKGTFVILR